MVTQVTNMSRTGVSDWMIQRVSAVVLAAYTICLLGLILMTPGMTFAEWQALIATGWMKIFTLAALLAACAHAWIGLWTVGSDYLGNHALGESATTLRFLFQVAVILILIAYLLWGVSILWSH